MADFTTEIENPYGVDSYENTKKTYDWVYNALRTQKFVCAKIQSDFLFSIGNITCNCKNIREFTENAYGQENYHLIKMCIFQVKVFGNAKIFIHADSSGLRICANNKQILEKVVYSLQNEFTDKHLQKSKVSQWGESILQGLLTNWIWATLVAGCTALFAFLQMR